MASKGKRKAVENDEQLQEGGNKERKTADEDDTITACELSKNRKVCVRKWKNQLLIDIREFFYKGSQCMPGKKGIALTLDQWNVLQEHIEDIDTAIKGVS